MKEIRIKKTVNGKDASLLGAFKEGSKVDFSVFIPRELGVISAVLRICRDGEGDRDIPFEFADTECGVDEYRAVLNADSEGLYYYELIFNCGSESKYTSSVNNVSFELSERPANRFRLLVYEKEFDTPSWVRGKTVYHIFVDRFNKGNREVPVKDGALINENWECGVPQYPEKSGDKLSNNVFFGGTLFGVIEKLPFIKELGADIIYLSPIFEAYSNHKYDTANYECVDSMFGGNEALTELIREAKKQGIKIILDGVFNHSGDDSVYFDKYGHYGKNGAYSSPDSPYIDWYNFKSYPDEYECWWGIDIHPRFNHENSECREYFVGEGGICGRYVGMGIGGWRLDVADELSDEFLDGLRKSVKSADPEAFIIGEVWENAADKVAYGKRRRYLRGRQLDSVMNYPLRSAVIDYLRYRDAEILSHTLVEIYSSYPKCVCDCLLNVLGTHDTERIITLLGGMCDETQLSDGLTNAELANKKLPKEIKEDAKKLLKLAAVIQFTVYGIPSVFYGDEAGLEGYHDPFCRKPYPWDREDTELLSLYKKLGEIRRKESSLAEGEFRVIKSCGGVIVYTRGGEDGLTVAVNRDEEKREVSLEGEYIDILSSKEYNGYIEGNTAKILKRRTKNGNI